MFTWGLFAFTAAWAAGFSFFVVSTYGLLVTAGCTLMFAPIALYEARSAGRTEAAWVHAGDPAEGRLWRRHATHARYVRSGIVAIALSEIGLAIALGRFGPLT